jgi:hypothetical protein
VEEAQDRPQQQQQRAWEVPDRFEQPPLGGQPPRGPMLDLTAHTHKQLLAAAAAHNARHLKAGAAGGGEALLRAVEGRCGLPSEARAAETYTLGGGHPSDDADWQRILEVGGFLCVKCRFLLMQGARLDH